MSLLSKLAKPMASPVSSRRIATCRRSVVALLGGPGSGKTQMLAEVRAELGPSSFLVRCGAGVAGTAPDPFGALVRRFCAANLLTSEWAVLSERPVNRTGDLRDALATATGHGAISILIDDLHLADAATLAAFELCVDRLADYPIRWFVTAAAGFAGFDAMLARLRSASLVAIFQPAKIPGARVQLGRWSLLSVDERAVAVALAAAHRTLDIDSLARVAGQSPERVLRALPATQRAGLVQSDSPGYATASAAAREVCLQEASATLLRRVHSALAETEPDEMRRAAHLEEAGDVADAAQLYLTVALEALEAARFDAAAAACVAVRRTTGSRTAEHRASIAIEELCRRSAGAHDAVVHAGRATLDELLGELPLDLRVRCEGAYYSAAMQFVTDRAGEARGIAALLETCRRHNVRGTAALYGSLAKLYYGLNEPARAVEELERGIEASESSYDPRTGIRLRIDLGFAKAALGERVAALELIERQIGRAFALGLNDEVCSGCCAAMYLLSALDRFEEAAHWGDYALAQPGPKSSRWIAILTYNLASIDIQFGRPELALGRVAGLRDTVAPMRPADAPMVAVLETLALAQTDRYDAASTALREALRSDAPEWVRLELRNAESLLCELRGDLSAALEAATFVMRNPSKESNARRSALAACSAVARLRFRLGERDFGEPLALCEAVVERSSFAKVARDEILAYATLASEPSLANAQRLVAATASNPDRFTRALALIEGGAACGDSALLDAALAEFEAIGSPALARRVRAAAAPRRIPLARRVPRRRHLTQREAELARYVAAGKTNAEIANLLGLSPKTVGHHLSNILSKCGVRSRVDVASLVIRGKLPLTIAPPA
jgi:DNA-binding CsgD family transcriptional regulator